MPHPRTSLTLEYHQGKIWAIGGSSTSGTSATDTVQSYDPYTDSWQIEPSMLAVRHKPNSWTANGRLYVAGSRKPYSNTIEMFNDDTHSWQDAGTTSQNTGGGGDAVLDGKIYLISGSTADGAFSNKVFVADLPRHMDVFEFVGEENFVNSPPSDLRSVSSSLIVPENLSPGQFVTFFTANDLDRHDLVYSLVDGYGSSGNSFFHLDANGSLSTAISLDYEQYSEFSIRVRVTDELNSTYEQNFEILVKDNLLDEDLILQKAPVPHSEASYGYAIAESAGYVLVGARYENNADLNDSGAAYLYHVQTDNQLQFVSRIVPGNPEQDAQFGCSVAIDGDYLLIGARNADYQTGDDAGGVYVYKLNEEAQPVFVTQLSPDNPTGSDQFGWSVDIDDGKILVGAHYLDANGNNSGQCFLYNIEENGSIVETDRFIGSDSANWDKFGGDVSISQNLIAVGSLESDATGPSKSGAAFYFRIEQNGTVTELQKIVDIPQVEQDRFGERVAIDGNLIAIGSPRADYESLNDSGQVTVLKVDAEGNVDRIAKLHSPYLKEGQGFGQDVFVAGQFVGALSKGDNAVFFWEFEEEGGTLNYIGSVCMDETGYKMEGSFAVGGNMLFARLTGVDDEGLDDGGNMLVYNISELLNPELGNQAPADLNSTSALTITENQPIGTIVGEFNATDPEGGVACLLPGQWRMVSRWKKMVR